MKKVNRRTRLLIVGAVLALVLVAIYLVGALIGESSFAPHFMEAKRAPTAAHLFGTDALGRDLFFRTLKGLSVSMTVGIAASLVSAVIALLVGMSAALGSKRVDSAVGFVIDLFMSVPHVILIILISFALGRGLTGLFVGISLTHWCSLARVCRAEVLHLRSQHYVSVSRRLGKSSGWILWHHFMPHLLPQILVGLVLAFPHAILHEATVSFLGFGLSPESPSIGIILSESMRYLSTGMWWQAVLPGVTLVLIVLLIDRLGTNLRAVLDPYSTQE